MKKIFVIGCVLVVACQMFAVVVDVPKVSFSQFADGESSRDQAFQSNVPQHHTRTFKVEISFNATFTNNVQDAFGSDSVHIDSKLSAEETDLILGWDCGKWFLRPKGLRTCYDFSVTNFVAGQRTLKASIEISPSGEFKAITFNDNGQTFPFTDFNLKDNSWLKPDDWSLLRVTTRGADVADEDVRVRFDINKTVIIIQ